MTLGLMLMLLTSAANAASSMGSVGIDIIGSQAENTNITAPFGASVELDILGSTATDIQISSAGDRTRERGFGCSYGYCDSCGGTISYTTPWDDFKRPLCYPWSTYIPTRYNKAFHIRTGEFVATSARPTMTPGILKLGRMTSVSDE